MNQFIINVDIFDCCVHVLDGLTDDEFYSYIDSNFRNQKIERMNTTASCWNIRDKNNKVNFLLDFKKKIKKDYFSIDTITHESCHASRGILKICSIPYSEDDGIEEIYCYLSAFIAGRVYKGIFEK